VRHGASPDDLATIAGTPIAFEIMGMNFYPQWSTRQLYVDRRGRLAYRPIERDGEGFVGLIQDYYGRYGLPIIVTETSARGSVEVRARWLKASVAAIKQLRSGGVPVLGYTWFPLFTMIDWRYRFGRGAWEDYRLELGLYTLDESNPEQRWRATPLVEQFSDYVNNPEETIGLLASTEPG
jgi:beta-glucosidase/6-phospho-beta-glucosidase/beta-galactosidase